MLTANIFDIHRGTTHDGPGMRTAFFFKGCPLNCRWCHNPEGISFKPQIMWNARKCINCLTCTSACRQGAITNEKSGIIINSQKCTVCGTCTSACPSKAITMVGKEFTLDELMHEAVKDASFFDEFEGGITASGGEPTAQIHFLTEFFIALKKSGIHTALDTCGFTPQKSYEAILPYCDCILYDIKFYDDKLHKIFTDQDNRLILDNLLFIAKYIRESNKKISLWIRTPLIPEATATVEDISQISEWIHLNIIDVMDRWELCAFNNLCKDKYHKINLEWQYEATGLMQEQWVSLLLETARKQIGLEKVFATGLTLK